MARMLAFYPGLDDEKCLRMPVNRFMALYREIPYLELEKEARQLTIVHNGKPQERLKDIDSKLRKRMKKQPPSIPITAMASFSIPGVGYESQAGSIEALRERQKASAERLRREFEESKVATASQA